MSEHECISRLVLSCINHRSFNYVRTFRKRYALTEFELAFLIGQRSDRTIYGYERGDRNPTLEAAIALQIIFSQVPHQLFPGLYEDVEDKVMRRAAQMLRQLEHRHDRRTEAKRGPLETLPRNGVSDIEL